MTIAATRRPVLRLLEPDAETSSWFCGHCGAPAQDAEPTTRVCPECAAGLLVATRRDALPARDDAFLIVDSSLAVQALSEHAEYALGVREEQAVNRHVTELLIPGDVEADTPISLAGAIVRAAGGDPVGTRVAVRPSQTFGVRLLARIDACGPPSAALLVLDQPATVRS
jgi:hypothetical protein